MITTKTVLVLGAGASLPYGLPLGAHLRDAIRGWHRGPSNDGTVLKVARNLDLDAHDLTEMSRHFERSGLASIDRFLELWPEYAPAGRFAIAYELVAKERPELLGTFRPNDWYSYLWGRLSEGANTFEEFKRNDVKVLTFNYDRSLEAFLDRSARYTYKNVPNDAVREVIPIIHFYGDLGAFASARDEQSRPYSPDLTAESIRVAVSRLRIIPDERAPADPFATGRYWLGRAEQVVILGFGFDPVNCERLGLLPIVRDTKASSSRKRIFATTFGMTEAEADSAEARVCESATWHGNPAEAVDALREWHILR